MSVLSDLYPRRLVSIGLRVCSSQISNSGDGFRCECLLRENVKMRIVKCHLSCQLKYEKIDHYQVLWSSSVLVFTKILSHRLLQSLNRIISVHSGSSFRDLADPSLHYRGCFAIQ